MKRGILIAAFAAVNLWSYAQQLKGKVFDASTNTPLAGATVSLAGKAATTDNDGTFSIDCSKSSEISISFVGFETYKQKIRNCEEELRVSLQSTGRTLDNVEISSTASTNKNLLY